MSNKTQISKLISESIFKTYFRKKKSVLIVILVVVITAFSIVSLSDLRVNPKWSNALPKKDTLISEYLKLVEDSLRGSIVYAIIEGSEKEQIAEEFSQSVIKLPDMRFVFDGRMKLSETGSSIFALDKQRLLQYLEIAKNLNIDQLINLYKDKLKDYIAVSNLVPETKAPTNNWNQFLLSLELALQNKPLHKFDELIDDMFFTQGNRIYSKDYKALLLLIGTDISEGSIDRIDSLSDSLNSIRSKILNRFPQSEIKLTGYPITARDEMHSISTSGSKMTALALIIVTAVLLFFYKEWKFVAASIGILCVGIIWTLALNHALFGELNTVTLIMGLILIGLGIDFSIHWINYTITNKDDNEKSPIIKKYLSSTATPILAGAFTTAASFLALLLFNVKSINEFGLMSFFGILLVAVLILLLMPIFINDFKDSSAYISLRRKIQYTADTVLNHKKKILLLGLLLISGSIWFLPQLKYEYNYAKLQIGNLPSYELKNEMNEKFGFASDVFLNRTNSIESDEEIKRKLETSEKIGYVLSISDYMPTDENLLQNKRVVGEIINAAQSIKIHEIDNKKLNLLRKDLEELSHLLTFVPTDSTNVSETLSILKRMINLLNVSTLNSLNNFNRSWVEAFRNKVQKFTITNQTRIENLPEKMHHLFGTSHSNEFVQYIFPINDTWEAKNIESLEPTLFEMSPNAVGLSRISYHISNWIVDEVITISITSLLVIIVTLLVTQRNLKFASMAIIPLFFGVLFTLATLSLLNIKVSLYNLIGLPIILGVGIDNGIHVVHAYRERFENGYQKAFLKVGPALFLTALTSMIGFGFLSFYTHPGISSLGIVAFIGIGWCFITTILFLPIVINHFNKKYSNR